MVGPKSMVFWYSGPSQGRRSGQLVWRILYFFSDITFFPHIYIHVLYINIYIYIYTCTHILRVLHSSGSWLPVLPCRL